MPEFGEWNRHLGQSMGRLDRDFADAGDYVYAVTDEDQQEVEVDAVGSYTQVSQSVDVTSLSAIRFRIRHKASSTHSYRVQAGIAGVDVFDETIVPGDADQDWRYLTIPCGKLTGSQSVYVVVSLL